MAIWPAWFGLCFFGALFSLDLLQMLPVEPNAWLAHWADSPWLLDLWFLAGLPALAVFGVEWREGDGFAGTRLALGAGMGLAPWALGAFPPSQVLGFSFPFMVLSIFSRLLPKSKPDLERAVWTLVAFNFLAVVHGIWAFPGALGGALLAVLLSFGLRPYGLSEASWGAAAGLVFLGSKLALGWNLPWTASASISALVIASGWALRHRIGMGNASSN